MIGLGMACITTCCGGGGVANTGATTAFGGCQWLVLVLWSYQKCRDEAGSMRSSHPGGSGAATSLGGVHCAWFVAWLNQ
jgi:hypothetical protein